MKHIFLFTLLLTMCHAGFSQEEEENLFTAIRYGDVEQAAAFIDRDSNVNESNIQGLTPLIYAAHLNQAKMVAMLLSKGANPDKFLDDGATALHLAVANKNHQMTALLIKHGASLNVKMMPKGTTPLALAIRTGNLDLVKLLVEAGAGLDWRLSGRTSLLFDALSLGYTEIAEYLLSKGLNINEQDVNGDTMAMWAIKEGKPDFFNFLVAHHADFSIKNNLDMTALDIAKELNFKYYIKALMKLSAPTPDTK